MNRNTPFIAAFILFLLSATPVLLADEKPNYDREARLAEEIVDDIFDGEPIWLEANGRQFLGIYTEAEDDPKGTVIILHGRGYHPDWPQVAQPLRTQLIEEGWATLSLQMPVLENGKKYFDYLPILSFAHDRIQAGIKHAREAFSGPVVLAAHSCGAHMANDWMNQLISQNETPDIDGYIIMGAGATDAGQDLKTPFPFAGLKQPILDLYGELEFSRPLAMREERKRLMKEGGNPDSKLVSLAGSNHYFTDKGDELSEAVAKWLSETNFNTKK